jgi:hypothetical protein
MFTFRNLVALALFLFGTTFLWMTASFTGRTPTPDGPVWTIENVLSLVAVVLFSVAAWAVWKDLSWWEPVTLIAGIVGLVSVGPFVVGIVGLDGFADGGVQINLWMHVLGSAAVMGIVLLPLGHEWITQRL